MRPLLILIPALLALPVQAQAETASIDFPAGWKRTELPAPAVGGKELTGGRHRAFLNDPAGKPLAVIELTELVQTVDTSGSLPLIMSITRDTAVKGYEKLGLQDECSAPASTEVARTPALRIDCAVSRDGNQLIGQIIILWATPSGVYTISYTGQPGPYEENMPTFEAALASITLN